MKKKLIIVTLLLFAFLAASNAWANNDNETYRALNKLIRVASLVKNRYVDNNVEIKILFEKAAMALINKFSLDSKILGPNAFNDENEVIKTFTHIIVLIQDKHKNISIKRVIEDAIQTMLKSLDPHSAYLSPKRYDQLMDSARGNFSGVGIRLSFRDNFVTVISPIPGTPAFKAGIKTNDRIIKIDHKPVKDLSSAVSKMRGPVGEKVVITIIRDGEKDPIDFELIRATISIDTVKAHMLPGNIGYAALSGFGGKTTKDLKKALAKLNEESSLRGLILDLRNNGGGLLNQSIRIVDLFIDKGIILSIRGRGIFINRSFSATNSAVNRDYPIIVLINGGSASASEIVAGALKDHKRALILGTTSFGKGSVQVIIDRPDGSCVKLTVARYYTPNGDSIQARGIIPDIRIEIKKDGQKEVKKENRMPKESDLDNHLEVEKNQKTDKKPKDAEQIWPANDIQVMTALKILNYMSENK